MQVQRCKVQGVVVREVQRCIGAVVQLEVQEVQDVQEVQEVVQV
jgi:hypothetical protein